MNAIETLRSNLDRGDPGYATIEKPLNNHSLEYAIWRFLHAWRSNPTFGPDHAVLLRQIARWQDGNLFIRTLPNDLARYSGKAGVQVTPAGDLTARPYTPHWMKGDCIDANVGIDAKPVLRRCPEDILAEPYLSSLHYNHWQSQAQKEAAWMTLTAPPGSTTLIALPTGTGKSLCFQLLSRFRTGLTVVIVPTVALAIDQWRSAQEVLGHIPDLNPVYFAAGDPDVSADKVVSDLCEGRTRLVFTSPEACVSGRLRRVIEEAASASRLENLVIDEAHIIETWGAYFRIDFQMLSTLRSKWMKLSGATLRTFLLSATFTPQCREMLQKLFGTGGEWHEFISHRLRPEMIYYYHQFQSDEDRNDAVREAAWRLPRPAIFYTTEVKEAKALFRSLTKEEGFVRVGCFHGETRAAERRSLLYRWRADEIDIMVATSAFGLGVDKADVRAVLHACFPENLHRYYQEVGRGGRDGASAVCILMPTKRDIEVAKGLTPKLLTEEVIQKRWEGLWEVREADSEDENIWRLRTDSKRTELLGTRTWSETIQWNKRLILQLLRARKLELLEIKYSPEEKGRDLTEWLTVKVNFPPASPRVGASISAQREEELSISQLGFLQMEEYLKGRRCIGRILRDLYGRSTQRVCGACRVCRQQERQLDYCPKLQYGLHESTRTDYKVVINCPNPFYRNTEAAFIKLIRMIVDRKQIRRFGCDPVLRDALLKLFGRAFRKDDPQSYRIDALNTDPPFDILPDEKITLLHIDHLDPEALRFSRGREVIHLICSGVRYIDSNDRYPLESQNASLEPDPEFWLREA
jgi:ATP-dependent DNA helicase RecQ